MRSYMEKKRTDSMVDKAAEDCHSNFSVNCSNDAPYAHLQLDNFKQQAAGKLRKCNDDYSFCGYVYFNVRSFNA